MNIDRDNNLTFNKGCWKLKFSWIKTTSAMRKLFQEILEQDPNNEGLE